MAKLLTLVKYEKYGGKNCVMYQNTTRERPTAHFLAIDNGRG
jgi:hypothetical protein